MNMPMPRNGQPRIAFIGNCQAQSLESLVGHLGLPLEVVRLPPVFDLPTFGQRQTWERIASCDFVFNQRVAGDYPVEFARPDVLLQRVGKRSISWPNVYFDGYFPDIQYVYTHSGKVVGPLSDYHFGFIRSAWASGVSVARLEQGFRDGAVARSFRHGADRSLHELRKRENGLSVAMSDWIASRWRYSKVLHVMNHPDNATLLELLRRLLKAASLDVALDASLLPSYPYPLDEIMLPAFPAVREWAGLRLGADSRIRGKRMHFGEGSVTMLREPAEYDWTSLFETYFRLYDVESARSAEVSQILRNTLKWVD